MRIVIQMHVLNCLSLFLTFEDIKTLNWLDHSQRSFSQKLSTNQLLLSPQVPKLYYSYLDYILKIKMIILNPQTQTQINNERNRKKWKVWQEKSAVVIRDESGHTFFADFSIVKSADQFSTFLLGTRVNKKKLATWLSILFYFSTMARVIVIRGKN